MALLFMDSFDHYATADLVKKWSTLDTGSAIAPAISGTGARTGVAGLTWAFPTNGTGSAVGAQTPTVTVAPGTAAAGVVGLAIKVAVGAVASLAQAGGRLLSVLDGGNEQFSLRINSDGTLTAMRLTTVLSSTSGGLGTAWKYLEIKWTINNTTGTIVVHLDGAEVLSYTGDTQATTSATWQTFQLGPIQQTPVTAAVTLAIDDLYLCDQSGANGDFLGDMRVDAHWPTAAGTSSTWTRSTGADQWATIDDPTPNDDTDYNETTPIGNTDTLNFPALTNMGATIAAVQISTTTKKTTAGGGAVAAVIRHGSTDYAATAQGVSTTYLTQHFCYDTNPGTSAAWTEADFNAAEFGYRKTA